MPVTNDDIADRFHVFSELLALTGGDPFAIRAYEQTARFIRTLTVSLEGALMDGEDLTALPTIGDDIACKIAEVVQTGTFHALDQLEQKMPPDTAALLLIPGIGPKRLRTLRKELGIVSQEELRAALDDGRVRQLKGFGPVFEERARAALDAS
ncbi:hypothetical protein HK107_14495 [Parvularcula sp. ZS-1/3]|uniref:Crossover junction endonuclease MUS81-like HHH domain-containing protein n=1 Tax=Parvularcula mediterranea TaxID=2732508 RepID=A0A7Y3RNV6_9PROT|nr:helix-hairpin-helix domain-containing protein [Parvularcula mediterranea]NNU17537.1 hypothetical protein [Parvularcula mediterranea]